MALIKEIRDYLRRVGNDYPTFPLSNLLPFCQQNQNLEFLTQITKHWKPDQHVFKFGQATLCPMFEELGSIFGEHDFSRIYIPPKFEPLASDISRYLRVTIKQAEEWIVNEKFLNFELILRKYPLKHLSQIPSKEDGERLQRILTLLVLSTTLLCQRNDFLVPIILVDVAFQIPGKALAPLVAAETILALDRATSAKIRLQEGAPLIIQYWLYEKLRLLTPLREDQEITPSTYVSRPLVKNFPTGKKLISRLFNVRAREVLDTRNIWKIESITYGTLIPGLIQFPGLTEEALYALQYDIFWAPLIPEHPSIPCLRQMNPHLRPFFLDRLKTVWENRHVCTISDSKRQRI